MKIFDVVKKCNEERPAIATNKLPKMPPTANAEIVGKLYTEGWFSIGLSNIISNECYALYKQQQKEVADYEDIRTAIMH